MGVQPHVLRYWEKEVSAIRPGKTASNQRRYRRKDVEVFREIRRLLQEEKYTLAGAQKKLANPEKSVKSAVAPNKGPTSAPVTMMPPEPAEQLPLGFAAPVDHRLSALREGLLEIIRVAEEQR